MPRMARFIFASFHVVATKLLLLDGDVVTLAAVGEHELLGLHEHQPPDPQHGSYTRPA